jgi:hypothetical protein
MGLDVVPEQKFRRYLDKATKRDIKYTPRFTITPKIKGVRGYDGKDYLDDLGWKYQVRRAASQMLPWLWI